MAGRGQHLDNGVRILRRWLAAVGNALLSLTLQPRNLDQDFVTHSICP